MWASVRGRLWPRRKVAEKTAIDQLKAKRQEYLEQLAARKQTASAGKRFEAAPSADAAPLPMTTDGQAPAAPKAAPPAQAAPGPAKPPAAPPSHLDQLLSAKRKTKDNLQGPKKDSKG